MSKSVLFSFQIKEEFSNRLINDVVSQVTKSGLKTPSPELMPEANDIDELSLFSDYVVLQLQLRKPLSCSIEMSRS